MESQFEKLMQEYGIISEKNETALLTSTNLPGPGTEVSLVSNAASHPFVKSKGAEFQAKVKQYVADNKKKTKKYRLIISNVKNVRPSIELAGDAGSSLGYVADVIEQIGPSVMSSSFSIPLDCLVVVNAAHNQNAGEIPDSWKQNMDKYSSFAQVIKGYSLRGEQPKSNS